MSADKTIRRVAEPEQQQAETYRYWQSLSIGERLSAVWDLSAAAYSFAAAFKGTPPNDARRRATKDLDIFVRSEEENSKAIFRALAQYGAPLDGLTPSDFMDGTTFQIGQPPTRIDILQQIDGVTFDEAWENRIDGLIDGQIRAGVISRNDLIRNKLASGREQDMLDVKTLRAASKNE